MKVISGLKIVDIDKEKASKREETIKKLNKMKILDKLYVLDPMALHLLFFDEIMDNFMNLDEITMMVEKNWPEMFTKRLLKVKVYKSLDTLVRLGFVTKKWMHVNGIYRYHYRNFGKHVDEMRRITDIHWLNFTIAPRVFYPDVFNKIQEVYDKIDVKIDYFGYHMLTFDDILENLREVFKDAVIQDFPFNYMFPNYSEVNVFLDIDIDKDEIISRYFKGIDVESFDHVGFKITIKVDDDMNVTEISVYPTCEPVSGKDIVDKLNIIILNWLNNKLGDD